MCVCGGGTLYFPTGCSLTENFPMAQTEACLLFSLAVPTLKDGAGLLPPPPHSLGAVAISPPRLSPFVRRSEGVGALCFPSLSRERRPPGG